MMRRLGLALAVLLVAGGVASAATCTGSGRGGCIPGLSPTSTTGARGIRTPTDCICDYEDVVNLNWDKLNADGCFEDSANTFTTLQSFNITGDAITATTINPTFSTSASVPTYTGYKFAPDYVSTIASPILLNAFIGFHSAAVTESATDGGGPNLPDMFMDLTTVKQTAGSGASLFNSVSFYSGETHGCSSTASGGAYCASAGNLSLTGSYSGTGLVAGHTGFLFFPVVQADSGKTTHLDQVVGMLMMPLNNGEGGGFTPPTTCAGTCDIDAYYGSLMKDQRLVASVNVDTLYGHLVESQTGTGAFFPYAAEEDGIAGTVPSGTGVWGVESGSPNRFYAKNENQQVWYPGPQTTWTGSTTGNLDNASNNYVGIVGQFGTLTTGTNDVPAPGALKVHAMACAVSAATGAAKSWQFTLHEAGAATGAPVRCTITNASTCTWCVAASGTPCTTTATSAEAVAAGALLEIEVDPTSSPTAAQATCTIWWTLDAF